MNLQENELATRKPIFRQVFNDTPVLVSDEVSLEVRIEWRKLK